MDYHKKKLNNPFLSKQKKKKKFQFLRKISLRAKLILVVASLAIGGLIWFFVFCPVWNIDRINVSGAERVSSTEIKNTARQTMKEEENLILFDIKAPQKAINEKFRLKEVSLEKEWPNTLLINIKEEPYSYIWLEGKQYYYADKNGFTLKKINREQYINNKKEDNLPLIVNKTNKEKRVQEGRIQVENDRIDFILDLYDEFNQNNDEIKPEKFILSPEANKVTAFLKQGPKVYFDSSGDPKEQLRNLLIVKEQKIKKDFKNKQYIDIRYEDRIYYQ